MPLNAEKLFPSRSEYLYLTEAKLAGKVLRQGL